MSDQREFHPPAYDNPNCNCRKLGLNPMFCMTGHLLECHYPLDCEEANCSHFQAKDEIEINGAWTHLLRSSCSKMYDDAGAKHSIVQKKLRHGGRDVTDRYTKVDMQTLLDFDEEHFHTCLAKPVLEKPFVKPLIDPVP